MYFYNYVCLNVFTYVRTHTHTNTHKYTHIHYISHQLYIRSWHKIYFNLQAANPGCLLEDFVRWYSPRDWIEGEEEEVMTSLPDNTTLLDPSTGSSKDSAPTKERLQYEETGEGDGWEDEDWDVVIEDEQKVDYSNEPGDVQEQSGEEEGVKLQTSPKV